MNQLKVEVTGRKFTELPDGTIDKRYYVRVNDGDSKLMGHAKTMRLLEKRAEI
jgi:hypothetical protein